MQKPDRDEQVRQAHAAFICQIVAFAGDAGSSGQLEQLLQSALDNGWQELVAALRLILAGQRDGDVLRGLDDEDRVIAESVLRGLQDPATLPDPNARPDPAMAAPGLAQMIHKAGRGNVQALTIVSQMAEQMSKVGGGMAQLAALIRPMINGERDPQVLCARLDTRGERLVLQILDELGKYELH